MKKAKKAVVGNWRITGMDAITASPNPSIEVGTSRQPMTGMR